ncbi:hypothetical protein AGMMS50293_02060 [Spirochaetia bacterium]|nr:hypothetical protein AGMMS50293_02060 [Spirochaetia bacterium]
MTDEEYDVLEDEVTRNPPKVDPTKARHPVRMISVDDLSADWLRIKAAAGHTTPEAIIGELVRKEIAATV